MSLLKGTPIPHTQLIATRDIPTMHLIDVLGPQIGALYVELMSVDPDALTKQQTLQRNWLRDNFEVARPDYTGRVTEYGRR